MMSDAPVCEDCAIRPATIETTIVALTDDAPPVPASPRVLCTPCLAALVKEGNRRGWQVESDPLTYPRDAAKHLDALIDAVGLVALSGYRIGDELVALILDRPHPIVATQTDGQLWLLAEVGVEGDGVYPEDDLNDELETEIPTGHLLWWDDNQERALLARRLSRMVSAKAFEDAVDAFEQLADEVEKRLTAIDDLVLRPSSSAEDLSDRPLMPPRGS